MAIAGATIYTFDGTTFYRRTDTGDEYDEWFPVDTTYTKDAILDSDEVYLDDGGSVSGPLTIRAYTDNESDRTTLITARGTVATLSNTRGYSRSAKLVRVAAKGIIAGLWYAVELTFEPV